MKKLMSGFGILLLCFVATTHYTYADDKSWENNTSKGHHNQASNAELSPRQIEIIQTVLNPDGYISKELHSEYWGLMPVGLINDKQALDAMAYFMEKSFVYGIQFTREGFASMKASIKAGRVVKTQGYESAKGRLYTSVAPEARQMIQKSIDNTQGMITAASKNKPFQSNRGTIYITLEMVNQVIAGLDGSFSRARRLMSPEWKQEVDEYHLDALQKELGIEIQLSDRNILKNQLLTKI